MVELEPLVPDPAVGDEAGPLELETELDGARSVPEFELDVLPEDDMPEVPDDPAPALSRLGVFTLMSVLELLDDGARSVFAPADELPGVVVVVVVDDDPEGLAGVTVVVDEDEVEVSGRADEPVVLFLLSPQALSAAATAVTTASFAKVRKVLSIYTLHTWD